MARLGKTLTCRCLGRDIHVPSDCPRLLRLYVIITASSRTVLVTHHIVVLLTVVVSAFS